MPGDPNGEGGDDGGNDGNAGGARWDEIGRRISERRLAEHAAAEEAYRHRAEEEARNRPVDPYSLPPYERADLAFQGGERLFQVTAPLSHVGAAVSMLGGSQTSTRHGDHGAMLGAIESAGWLLTHADYVFQVTGTTSRDKLLSSGQVEAVAGQIVGIYVFRRCPENRSAPSTGS